MYILGIKVKYCTFVPMKSILSFLAVCVCMVTLGSCSGSQRKVVEGSPYTLTGTLWQDSTTVDSVVTLIIDRHELSFTLDDDSIPVYQEIEIPVVDGHFSYKGNAPVDVDELYLYDQHNHVVRFYAASGADLEVNVLQDGTIEQRGVDTTNLVAALILRDSIPYLSDSLYVRRILGRMPESAKPNWLIRSFDQMLDQKARVMGRNTRLPRVNLVTPDTIFPVLGSRIESLLLLFWSCENAASMDSLQNLKSIAQDYGLYQYAESFVSSKSTTRRIRAHRIQTLSVCMYAPDSVTWKSAIEGIPGHHAILPGGYAHPLATTCDVTQLPSVVLVDRFGNYQISNVWGNELYQWLDKTPLNSALNAKLKK